LAQPRPLERAKLFFFRHFERIFVLLLVLAMARFTPSWTRSSPS